MNSFLPTFLIIPGLAAALLLFVLSCAVQRAPSGGPPDKTPPRIVAVIPAKNTTLVPLDQEIEFSFSEGMDQRTLERAIFITPDPGERVELKWKGKRLRIKFKDSLGENRTYVITLGTDLKDERGNALAQSYTLAFSTGEKLSDGRLSGRVYSAEKQQGVLVWAYILDDENDPDPTKSGGDYATQTDTEGKFQLSHLSEGNYRVFAIWDKDNNRFFEVGLDAIGMASKDFQLSPDSLTVSDINFQLSMRDTLRPGLLSVSVEDRNHLRLTFDEELQEDETDEPANFIIRDIDKDQPLEVRQAYLDLIEKKEAFLVTAPQNVKTKYRLSVTDLRDRAGNQVDPNFNSAEFVGSAVPDSIRPRLTATAPKDSAHAVLPDAKIVLHFSEPISRQRLERNFTLKDSSTGSVSGSFLWPGPASVEFSPDRDLKGSSAYVVTVLLDSVFDDFGNSAGDSTFILSFQTVNTDTFSSISGEISDADSLAEGAIFLKAVPSEKSAQSYEIRLNAPGPYVFSKILPGTYTIQGFRDSDGNGKYSFGRAVPFVPAERFFVYEQQIKVRARWPNEGNNIRID